MLAIVRSCAVVGLYGHIIDVEVDFSPRTSIHSFMMVGLAEATVSESREWVRAVVKNSNRATIRRMRGGSSQGLDGLASTLGDQNQHRNEEHHFGLQFPNRD